MADSDASEKGLELLREARRELDERAVQTAVEKLLAAKEAGFFHPELDAQIEKLRGEPDEAAREETRVWLEELDGVGDQSGSDAGDPIRQFDVEASADGGFAGVEKSHVEGARERPDEDSTAREAGDEAEQSDADFTRDSNEVTAVNRKSLADLDSDELEEVDRDMEGASAEFDRLPSAELDVVETEESSGDGGEAEESDEDRETERNPVVDKIAWEEIGRAHDSEDRDDAGAAFDGPGAPSSYAVEDSGAEEFDERESSGAMAAIETEREMQSHEEAPRRSEIVGREEERDAEDPSEASDFDPDAQSRPTSAFDAADPEEVPQPESGRLADGASRLLGEAEELLDSNKYDSAHDIVQSVLDRDPDSERAQELLIEIEQARAREGASDDTEGPEDDRSETSEAAARAAARGGEERLSYLKSLDAVPHQARDLDELSEEAADHRMGFVLSLVDGELSFEDILDLSSMPRSETAEVLADLVEEGVVAFDEE